MNFKRVLGVLAIVIGIALVVFVIYGKSQIKQAKEEISSAKKKVGQGNELLSLNPLSKTIGRGITGGVQKKIAQGERTVEQYEMIFMWCQISAIILIVTGTGLIFFGRAQQKKKPLISRKKGRSSK